MNKNSRSTSPNARRLVRAAAGPPVDISKVEEEAHALGIEIRSERVRGAVVDTSTGEFITPGANVELTKEVTNESVIEAVKKVSTINSTDGTVGLIW